jgi:N-acyl-L-homoserine lactone synthetase
MAATITRSIQPVSVGVARTLDDIRLAKRLCHDIYLEAGYIRERRPDGVIPHPYERDSIYIAARCEGRTVGTVRMTVGHSVTLHAWKGNLLPDRLNLIGNVISARYFEIGALAVSKAYRTQKVSWQLYRAVLRCSLALQLDYAIVAMDVRALRTLQMLGWLTIRIGKPIHYMGSMTIPAVMPVREQVAALVLKGRWNRRDLATATSSCGEQSSCA